MSQSERPFEIIHLPDRLRTDFTGRIAAATFGTPVERERNFLSRALAAYAIHKLAGTSQEEAATSLVDGGSDGGIDAIHHAPDTNLLWVVQSKYLEGGRGEPSLGDVAKFKSGLDHLLSGRFEAFAGNDSWNRRLPRIGKLLEDGGLMVRAALVYSGLEAISEDRLLLIDDLKKRHAPHPDDFDFLSCNLTTIHDWLTNADDQIGVPELEITLSEPGWVKDPYETIYGLVPLAELARLHAEHGKRLIAANIRAFKGSTEVNDQMLETIRREPNHFFYFNNGLTAFCQRFEIPVTDRPKTDRKRVRAFGFSIVNGAQTLGTVARAAPKPDSPGMVFIKIISLQRCDEDADLAQRITRRTNTQNRIGPRDFVSQDETQERISRQLLLSGIGYHYKDGADTPKPDGENFTLDEATTALACLIQQQDADFIARILANRQSLWSFDDTGSAVRGGRSRYTQVFRPEISARTVWRAVQAQRCVVTAMQESGRTSTGTRKAFFENARWLILNVLYLKLRPEQGEQLSLSPGEMSDISGQTLELAEVLWTLCEGQGLVTRRADSGVDSFETPRHFRSVFCSAPDCARLRKALLAHLALNTSRAVQPSKTSTGEGGGK